MRNRENDSSPEFPQFVSWAESILIRPGHGNLMDCPHCDSEVKFRGMKVKARMVVCNVYEEGNWQRSVRYHDPCYAEAENPYGEPGKNRPAQLPVDSEVVQARMEMWDAERAMAATLGGMAIEDGVNLLPGVGDGDAQYNASN